MSALRPGGSTRAWRRIRAWVLERDGHRCQVPGPDGQLCLAPASHVDHVQLRVNGGTDDPGNLRAACAPCNLKRGGQPAPARRAPRARWSW